MALFITYCVTLCLMVQLSANHITHRKRFPLPIKRTADTSEKSVLKAVSTTEFHGSDLVGKTKANSDIVQEPINPVKLVTFKLQNRFGILSGNCPIGYVKRGEFCLPEDYNDYY